MPSHTRPVVVLAVVCVLVLAGCSGGGGGTGGAGGGNASGGGAVVENAGDGVGGGGGAGMENAGENGATGGSAQAGDGRALQPQRAIIKTGHVRLDVENFSTARSNLTEAVTQQGGYVSASSETTQSVDGANVTRGQLVLRVPSRNFSALYSRVKAAGTVQDSRTNTTDVTGQVVDLRARLNNSRAQRDRLRNLYANASNTEATLNVQQRLSTVQSRIERLEGQLQSLRGQIAYSTITVEFSESTPEPTTTAWYDTGVLDALLASIGGVITTLQAIVVALAYLAPYLLVFGLPVGAVGYLAYRRRSEP